MIALLPILLAIPQLGAPQVYDLNGDLLQSGPGSNAPGDVLTSIVASGSGGYSGAARNGSTVLLVDSADGRAVIYQVSEATGAALGTIPILNAGDFGLGYDSSRDLYVTTNASSDVISTFTSAGALTSTWAAPGSGPVGAAHDAGRDVYWICDWSSNTVSSMSPVTGATLTTFDLSLAGCSRPAGVGFNLANDQIIVGGRDQGAVFVLDAGTGSLVRSFAAQIGGSNDPRGFASSSSGNVWQTLQNSNTVYELDLDNGLAGPVLSITGLAGGSTATISVDNATAGGAVLIGYSLTGAGPTNTPLGAVNLSAPITQLPTLTANASGLATMSTGVPGQASGFTLYMQAADLAPGLLSNALAEPIL
jgi:hypothetical protein